MVGFDLVFKGEFSKKPTKLSTSGPTWTVIFCNVMTGPSLKKMSKSEISQVHCGDDYNPHEAGNDRRCAAVGVYFA